jgi:hypothetical protein
VVVVVGGAAAGSAASAACDNIMPISMTEAPPNRRKLYSLYGRIENPQYYVSLLQR